MSKGIRTDRMKGTLERNQAHCAERERQAWLATLTPTHRRVHERQPAAACMDCAAVNVQRISREVQESIARMKAALRTPLRDPCCGATNPHCSDAYRDVVEAYDYTGCVTCGHPKVCHL